MANKKDKNLVKGLLMFLCLLGSIFVGAWLVFGEPLRAVGGLFVGYWLLRFGRALRTAFVTKPVDPKRFGQWCIVTGCTGGLGQEFARRAAKRGMHLMLVSRSQSKLDKLAGELRAEFGVQAVTLAFDFARSNLQEEQAFYDKVLPEFVASSPVEGNIGLLINNVGVGDEAPFAVEEITTADVYDMVKVNCGAIVNMSRAILPLMKHRRGGAVINVSSGSCNQPSPYLATYASTKAFDLHFSKSCTREYREFGVFVTGIAPYYIAGTGLYPNAKPSANAPAAKVIVEGAFKSLGKYETTQAYIVHSIMAAIFNYLFEDPLLAPVLKIITKPLGLNGNMLMIQKAARGRSQKNTTMWAPVQERAAEHLRRLGLSK